MHGANDSVQNQFIEDLQVKFENLKPSHSRRSTDYAVHDLLPDIGSQVCVCVCVCVCVFAYVEIFV